MVFYLSGCSGHVLHQCMLKVSKCFSSRISGCMVKQAHGVETRWICVAPAHYNGIKSTIHARLSLLRFYMATSISCQDVVSLKGQFGFSIICGKLACDCACFHDLKSELCGVGTTLHVPDADVHLQGGTHALIFAELRSCQRAM